MFQFFAKFSFFSGLTPKYEKLGTDITHTQNISIGTGPMSKDVFFHRAGECFNEIQNEFTDFLPEVVLHPKTTLNCGAVFAANSPDGILLDRVNPLLCKLLILKPYLPYADVREQLTCRF